MKNVSKLLTVTVVVLLVAMPVAAQPERADPTFNLRSVVSALADLADALLMRFQPEPRKLGWAIQPSGDTIPIEDQGSEPTPMPGGAGGVDAATVPSS